MGEGLGRGQKAGEHPWTLVPQTQRNCKRKHTDGMLFLGAYHRKEATTTYMYSVLCVSAEERGSVQGFKMNFRLSSNREEQFL